MDLDKKLTYLVKLAIISPKRREMYLQAIPKMTGEEKLKFGLEVWHLLLLKIENEMENRIEDELEELAFNPDKIYYEKEFKKIPDQIMREMIRERFEMSDEDKIEQIRQAIRGLESHLESISESATEAKNILKSHVD